MGEQQKNRQRGWGKYHSMADAAVKMETEVTSFCHERSLLPVFRRLHRPQQLGITVPQGCD